jgi:hypothetical protein
LGGLAKGVVGLCSTILTNPLVLQLLAVAGVGFAAYKVATAAGAGSIGEKLGGWLYDATHGDPMAQPPRRGYVPSTSKSGQSINNTIVMPDGRVLAKVVTEQWGNEMRRPSAGGVRVDRGMTPVSPGMAGAH